jgi:hypothetical protein
LRGKTWGMNLLGSSLVLFVLFFLHFFLFLAKEACKPAMPFEYNLL